MELYVEKCLFKYSNLSISIPSIPGYFDTHQGFEKDA